MQQGMQQGQFGQGQLGNPFGRQQMGGPNTGSRQFGGAFYGATGPVGVDYMGTYRGALETLRQLQQQFRSESDQALPRDIAAVIRDLQRLDPQVYQNDPVLAERINGAMLGNLEQIEMQLRRKAEENGGGNGAVRSQSGEPVPQGYSDAVAEYFRRLSKGK